MRHVLSKSAPTGGGEAGGVGRAAKTIAATTALAMAAAATYLALAPREFTAVSKLLVERAGSATRPAVSGDGLLAAQADVIRSTEVLRLADARGDLASLATFARRRDVVPAIRQDLKLDPLGDNVLSVRYAARSTTDAEKTVDAIVDAYASFQSDKRKQRLAELTAELESAREPIERQLTQATAALDAAQARLAKADPIDAASERLRVATNGLITAQAAVASARRDYDAATADAGPLLANLSDADLDRMMQQGGQPLARVIEQLETSLQRMTELRRTYAENHPAVVRLRGEIDALRLQHVAAGRQRWQGAAAAERDARMVADAAQAAVNAVTAAQRDFELRRDEVRDLRARVAESGRQLDAARAAATGSSLSIEILTRGEGNNPAYPPTPLVWPTLAIALVAGLGTGTLLATIGEYRRVGTLRHVGARPSAEASSSLARSAYDLRVLGHVPVLDGPVGPSDQASKLRRAASPISRQAADELAVTLDESGFARGTLCVTSAGEFAGRREVVRSLAEAYARRGQDVLLIEATSDGSESAEGFAEALADGDFASRVRPTPSPSLSVLPAGRQLADRLELLNSPRLINLLARAGEAFDRVLIDASPIADDEAAQLLAAYADATLLVTTGSPAALKQAAGGRDVLQLLGARVVGAVMAGGPQPPANAVA